MKGAERDWPTRTPAGILPSRKQSSVPGTISGRHAASETKAKTEAVKKNLSLSHPEYQRPRLVRIHRLYQALPSFAPVNRHGPAQQWSACQWVHGRQRQTATGKLTNRLPLISGCLPRSMRTSPAPATAACEVTMAAKGIQKLTTRSSRKDGC